MFDDNSTIETQFELYGNSTTKNKGQMKLDNTFNIDIKDFLQVKTFDNRRSDLRSLLPKTTSLQARDCNKSFTTTRKLPISANISPNTSQIDIANLS